jgi:glycosyltransferase involved in cell wall biosynthesis
MTTSRHYTLITPRADKTGPTNLAVDIGLAAGLAGWPVRLLYLSGAPARDDLGRFSEVRKWRLSDVWSLRGVVHTHGLRPDLVGWLFTWNRGCTVVTTLHGMFPQHLRFDYSSWKVGLAWCIWSYSLQRFHHVVCISRTMFRHYQRTLPTARLALAYNFRSNAPPPVPTLTAECLAWIRKQRSEGRIVMAYVGSLTSRKNPLPLIQHAAGAARMALILCGRGPLEDRLSAEVATAGSSNILFTGHLSTPDAVVSASDMLVLPSHAEGLPLVVLEAARLGVPALLSNIAVHRELAGLGLGLTFDHRRFSDFEAKMLALAATRSTRADNRRIEIWRDRFSPQAGFSAYESLVQETAGAGTSR